MKTGRGWWALAGMAAVSTLLLLAGYVGAYYMTVKPTRTIRLKGRVAIPSVHAVYRPFFGIHAVRVFEPMHLIDKRLATKNVGSWTASAHPEGAATTSTHPLIPTRHCGTPPEFR